MRLLGLRDVPANDRDRLFHAARERAVFATVAVIPATPTSTFTFPRTTSRWC